MIIIFEVRKFTATSNSTTSINFIIWDQEKMEEDDFYGDVKIKKAQ